MCLIAKVIRISHAKFHCNKLTTVQDIQNYASLSFLGHSVHYLGQFSHKSVKSDLIRRLCIRRKTFTATCNIISIKPKSVDNKQQTEACSTLVFTTNF